MQKKNLTLLAIVMLGSGCATTNGGNEQISTYAQLNIAAQQENCDGASAALGRLEKSPPDAELLAEAYLTTAHACITSSEPIRGGEHAERFLEKFPAHSSADYAAYLSIMGEFLHWRASTEADAKKPEAETIDQGRALLSRLVEFRGDYASSTYLERMIPVAKQLREMIADAELTLARQALADGDADTASSRARYVRAHYPNTQSGKDALDLLGDAQMKENP